jgi:CheY-like chemotaxis protein
MPVAPEPPYPSGTVRLPGRLLVVDDEPFFGEALYRALRHEHQVSVETDATSALARLARGERFDVILCDLMMPIMDGIEFHRRLFDVLPEQANRIVFITGGAITVRVESFLRRVENTFLEKPIHIDGLRALIERRVIGRLDGAACA